MVEPSVIAIVQARVGSTRLPNKVLSDIVGKPLLWHIIKRLVSIKKIDEVASILQIEPLLKRKPAQLSGGQRQRARRHDWYSTAASYSSYMHIV